MTKFICDYDQVTAVGTKICDTAQSIVDSVSSYASNLEEDLASWNSDARATFATENNERMDVVASKVQRIDEFGQYVKEVSKQIKDLDTEIAAIKI